MNNNVCDNSSSYCRRHMYSLHTCECHTASKAQRNKVYRASRDTDGKKSIDFNVLKNAYNKFISLVSDRQAINGMINKAANWLEVDDKALRVDGVKSKLPVKFIVSIAVAATSLMLIVSGAVISSKANMELYAAENRLKELRVYEAELDAALEVKNDLVYIEDVARNKLGMIDREYATVSYLDSDTDDMVEIYEKTEDRSAFYAILNALGFFGE